MRTILWIIVTHILGIAFLCWIALSLNTAIDKYATDYAGLITVFSTAFGIYSFTVNLLYQ